MTYQWQPVCRLCVSVPVTMCWPLALAQESVSAPDAQAQLHCCRNSKGLALGLARPLELELELERCKR